MLIKKQQARKTIIPPKLPQINEATFQDALILSEEASYSHLVLENDDLSGQIADLVSIEHAHFKNIKLGGTKLKRVQISDARLESCELSNAYWPECSLHRIEIIGCRMIGFAASQSFMRDTLFKDCKLETADFRFTKFKATRFENCNLREADFQNADLHSVVFNNCDLRGSQMSGAQLSGTDLRGSELDGIGVPLENLKGVIIDSSQIVELGWNIAKQIGIIVRDSDQDSCAFCSDTGRRLIKTKSYPGAIVRQCTHDPAVESKLESAY